MPRINPYAVDALLALIFTAAALGAAVARAGDHNGAYRSDNVFGIALLLLQTLPVAVRRVAPLAALMVSVVAVSVHIAAGYEGVDAGTFAALVILYSAASMSDMRGSLLAGAIATAGITVYFTTDRVDHGLAAAVSTYATYAGAWGLGVYVRSRREYTTLVDERATLIEREREVRAREAVASERGRIARELHDMVGHALNVIVIQSGGAQRVFATRPDLARDSLASIEAIGRDALGEMERMLGILRAPESAEVTLAPPPGLAAVRSLAAHASGAGLPVEIVIEGTPAPLPASIDLSAYRIIQETLTNALKHAGPAHARVAIRYRGDSVELEITDDGRGVASDGDHREGGRGLIGMRERVALFGGDLSAGPRPGGGYHVTARLPFTSGTE